MHSRSRAERHALAAPSVSTMSEASVRYSAIFFAVQWFGTVRRLATLSASLTHQTDFGWSKIYKTRRSIDIRV
jgi:hypothetical protein